MADLTTVAIFTTCGENSSTIVTRHVGKNNVHHSWRTSDCQFVWLQHSLSAPVANFTLIGNCSFSPLVKQIAIQSRVHAIWCSLYTFVCSDTHVSMSSLLIVVIADIHIIFAIQIFWTKCRVLSFSKFKILVFSSQNFDRTLFQFLKFSLLASLPNHSWTFPLKLSNTIMFYTDKCNILSNYSKKSYVY